MSAEKFSKLRDLLYDSLLGNGLIRYWLLSAAVFAVVCCLLLMLFRKRPHGVSQSVAIAAVSAYYLLVFSFTVLSRESDAFGIRLLPLWGYYVGFVQGEEMQIALIAINLVMLVPVGFLLPLCFRRRITWRAALLTGFLMSYFIEFCQLVFHCGSFELFDDPLNNIIGCMVGYALFRVLFHKRAAAQYEA